MKQKEPTLPLYPGLIAQSEEYTRKQGVNATVERNAKNLYDAR
jgi:hypothetical protein